MAPLQAAVESENLEIVKLLLSSEKININHYCKIEKGEASSNNYYYIKETALHLAISKINIEIVKVLLQNKNIDVNIPLISYDRSIETDYLCSDKDVIEYNTPVLILALSKKNLEIVKLLLDNKKLDINICMKKNYNWEGRSSSTSSSSYEEVMPALYYVINQYLDNSLRFVKLLLENDKIDVNAPYKKKSVSSGEKNPKLKIGFPLHLAVSINNIEILKLLLQNKNINVNVIDDSGKKPIDYADKKEKKQLLMNYS